LAQRRVRRPRAAADSHHAASGQKPCAKLSSSNLMRNQDVAPRRSSFFARRLLEERSFIVGTLVVSRTHVNGLRAASESAEQRQGASFWSRESESFVSHRRLFPTTFETGSQAGTSFCPLFSFDWLARRPSAHQPHAPNKLDANLLTARLALCSQSPPKSKEPSGGTRHGNCERNTLIGTHPI
jgi:hypothetical protein